MNFSFNNYTCISNSSIKNKIKKKRKKLINLFQRNIWKVITNKNIDENTGELEYTMVWNK